MGYYTTVALVKAELKGNVNNSSDDDIFARIGWCSDRIDEEMSTTYEPILEPRNLEDVIFELADDDTALKLMCDLLEVQSIVLDDEDSTTLDSDDVTLKPRWPTPYREIKINDSVGKTWQSDVDAITGLWGYRSNYNRAWANATALNGAIIDSATSLVVDSSAAFARGNLVRIDLEFVRVVSVTDATHIVVERGANGTTAVAHADDTPIELWTVEPIVVRAATRYAALMVFRRGAFESTQYDPAGALVQFPIDIPGEVTNILFKLRHDDLWSV